MINKLYEPEKTGPLTHSEMEKYFTSFQKLNLHDLAESCENLTQNEIEHLAKEWTSNVTLSMKSFVKKCYAVIAKRCGIEIGFTVYLGYRLVEEFLEDPKNMERLKDELIRYENCNDGVKFLSSVYIKNKPKE